MTVGSSRAGRVWPRARMRPGSLSPVSRSPAVDEVCEVVITAPDPEWLVELTHKLVTDRLCASGHNFAPIRTIYRWQGQVYERTGGSRFGPDATSSRGSSSARSATTLTRSPVSLPSRSWTAGLTTFAGFL